MRREVVQDFLNLPGIAGVALIDGRSRPYFCGIDQILNFQQKEALAQGIQQVVETTPTGFEFFEFQFTGHQVYIYKLDHGIILLVLTSNSVVAKTYVRAVELLKQELQDDVANAIATFRILAGNITLSNQGYWNRRSSPSSLSGTPLSGVAVNPATDLNKTNLGKSKPSNASENIPSRFPEYVPPDEVTPPRQAKPLASSTQVAQAPVILLKDILPALNHLSQFTTQYLGTTVIANYWKSTRPSVEWLDNFQLDRSAQFTFSGVADVNQGISAEEHQCLKEWVTAFIQRCSKVIRDFPLIIEQRALDDQQKMLLLSNKP